MMKLAKHCGWWLLLCWCGSIVAKRCTAQAGTCVSSGRGATAMGRSSDGPAPDAYTMKPAKVGFF